MNPFSVAALGLLVGFASALVPVINAEAYAVAGMVTKDSLLVVPTVMALATGQTAGKLVLYEAARRGSSRFKASTKLRTLASSRWSIRIHEALRKPRPAAGIVLVSAGLGLPPLALVSVAAGAAEQPRGRFALLCLLGRAARFAVLATCATLALA